MENLLEKYQNLIASLKELESVAVAFSGGVDSTFLLKAAHDALGERAIAVTARSVSFPKRELREALAYTMSNGIEHIFVDTEELKSEEFVLNSPDRCYICKKELFSRMIVAVHEKGISTVAEGSNLDDLGDYRPGLKAIAEFQVKSPLREAGLTKEEIRQLSKYLGLPTWEKPSFACLASRIPYGQKITQEKLEMIDRAEQLLLDLGIHQVRVRHHDTIARIEVREEDFEMIMESKIRKKIAEEFNKIGFPYTALDLFGYRTGSMNETIKIK